MCHWRSKYGGFIRTQSVGVRVCDEIADSMRIRTVLLILGIVLAAFLVSLIPTRFERLCASRQEFSEIDKDICRRLAQNERLERRRGLAPTPTVNPKCYLQTDKCAEHFENDIGNCLRNPLQVNACLENRKTPRYRMPAWRWRLTQRYNA